MNEYIYLIRRKTCLHRRYDLISVVCRNLSPRYHWSKFYPHHLNLTRYVYSEFSCPSCLRTMPIDKFASCIHSISLGTLLLLFTCVRACIGFCVARMHAHDPWFIIKKRYDTVKPTTFQLRPTVGYNTEHNAACHPILSFVEKLVRRRTAPFI